MAMTKRERAEFDALSLKLRTVSALRWTAPVAPDVLPPRDGSLRSGFTYVGDRGNWPNVSPACTSSSFHSTHCSNKTDTQRPKALYSTPSLALRALRYEVEQACADKLRKIDDLIAMAEAEASPEFQEIAK